VQIALVSEHASPLAILGGVDSGGQNVHVAALATELGRLGHEVVVHTRRDRPDLPRHVALARNVVVDHVDAGPACEISKDHLLPYMADFAADLRREWRRRRPDIAHAHFWMSGLATVTAARTFGIPVVQTFHALGVVKRRHQGDRDTSPQERIAIEARLVREVDLVIATCTDEMFELRRFGGDANRIEIVPCGVDLQRFKPHGRVEPRRSGRRRVVTVGRLVERKGIGNVVAAMAKVPDAELIIAGGPAADELAFDREAVRYRRLASEHGVSDRVELRGRVSRGDLPALIRSADVVACVPWYEPFGIVPLEAMACGVPVLATAVGGLVDTVVDGITGVHVPPRDPDADADALRRLLDDAPLRCRLGHAGVRRARDRYSWQRVARATQAAYRRAVLRSPATAERTAR
jgi:glycosyltransferase involved in cell wall biosynthesis